MGKKVQLSPRHWVGIILPLVEGNICDFFISITLKRVL